jgi:hypothetical protein
MMAHYAGKRPIGGYPGDMSPWKALLVGLILLGAFPVASAVAAPARPKTMFEDHLHNTGGNDWHVQLQANNTGTRLTTIVLYAETCDGSEVVTKVPIAADGTFAVVDHKLVDGKGSWSVEGRFEDPDHAEGTWSITRGTCSVADHPFAAHDGRGHFVIGNPGGYTPQGIMGSSKPAKHLRVLQRQTFANAHRWDTVAKAERLGYARKPSETCPGIFHLRKHGVHMWGKVLDPTAPQSLVFWCGQQPPTLVAAMYRAAGRTHPSTFGDLIQWHKHGSDATWMTHIWLVRDPVAAFAACAPFNALHAAGLATYVPYSDFLPIDQPCPDTAGLVADSDDAGAPPQ